MPLLRTVQLEYINSDCTICSRRILQSLGLECFIILCDLLLFVSIYGCSITNNCFQKRFYLFLQLFTRSANAGRRYTEQQYFFHIQTILSSIFTTSFCPSICIFVGCSKSILQKLHERKQKHNYCGAPLVNGI